MIAVPVSLLLMRWDEYPNSVMEKKDVSLSLARYFLEKIILIVFLWHGPWFGCSGDVMEMEIE